ncbi:ribbon-helix-helix domain-containing protein [Halobaculum sp. EA56]|uniref:ribbon-helix-helix domain-containing protein n=1 Tax=Halobaculum sp. EA56 TaxID=3421648 RepID=UPI003EB76CA3
MARITIRLPDDLDADVEEHIGYGSKSAFYREAAEEKLNREQAACDGAAAEQAEQ